MFLYVLYGEFSSSTFTLTWASGLVRRTSVRLYMLLTSAFYLCDLLWSYVVNSYPQTQP